MMIESVRRKEKCAISEGDEKNAPSGERERNK